MGHNESSGLALVVLAAGMGSRYGGAKVLDAVGPGGATLMDYAVFDAARSGFDTVVFIIKPEMQEFKDSARARYGARMTVRFAEQVTPAGRAKPPGTGHALLAAEPEVSGAFAVVNGDDFYGLPAYRAVRRFLVESAGRRPPEWAVTGYRLSGTLSDEGAVNRAVCRARDGWVESLEETALDAASAKTLPEDTLVSMNMWSFTRDIFDALRRGYAEFMAHGDAMKGEYLLPDAVNRAIEGGMARVRLLDPHSRWFGLTHRGDRTRVADALAALVLAGDYPEKLW